MNIEDYIVECREKRQGKSFAFLAERCAASEEAPYRITAAEAVAPEEVCVLVLAGTGGEGVFLRGYNGMLKKTDSFIKNISETAAENVRVCVAVCDFGKYHWDKKAREGMYYEAYWPEYLAAVQNDVPEYCREETFNPAYVKDIFDAAVLPRIAQNGGRKRLDVRQALYNIRRLNLVTHCHGGYVAMQLEKMMSQKTAELGYSAEEQKQLKSQFLVLNYNPDCPKHKSELRFIAIESAQDWHNRYNHCLKEWLLMERKDFGVCYQTKNWGRTLACSQIDKAGVEGNPAREMKESCLEEIFEGRKGGNERKEIGEHEFMGFEPVENMSKGALQLQKFANNILKNAVINSCRQKVFDFVPLPAIQNLAADSLRQKCEFARAVITGYRLEQQMMRSDRSKIDAFANWRRSMKTVTLD